MTGSNLFQIPVLSSYSTVRTCLFSETTFSSNVLSIVTVFLFCCRQTPKIVRVSISEGSYAGSICEVWCHSLSLITMQFCWIQKCFEVLCILACIPVSFEWLALLTSLLETQYQALKRNNLTLGKVTRQPRCD